MGSIDFLSNFSIHKKCAIAEKEKNRVYLKGLERCNVSVFSYYAPAPLSNLNGTDYSVLELPNVDNSLDGEMLTKFPLFSMLLCPSGLIMLLGLPHM